MLLGEATVVEGLGEHRDQVVGGAVAGLGAWRSAMSSMAHDGVLAEGLGRRVQHRVVGLDVAVAGHHGVGPAVHLQALLGVEAHELADDDQWHVDGEVLHEVDVAAVGDLVDDLVGELADVGDQLADPAGGEPLVDQPALADVLVAVEGDDRHVAGDLRAHARSGCSSVSASREMWKTSSWRAAM